MKGSIKQILAHQETNYKTIIDELLEKQTAVTFKINDMILGKCVFLQVSDIIETIKTIKEYVDMNKSMFTIEEIETRFTNTIPMSDVILQIVIDKKIKASLQLSIQQNLAVYNFSVNIYQLQWTKIFSKIKIVHNYY